MAVGAASMHVGAISNVVGLWFDRQRGLALSLALNGASSGGILVTPALVLAIAQLWLCRRDAGLGGGDGGGAAAGRRALDQPAAVCRSAPRRRRPPRPQRWTRRSALRSLPFWSVAAPFAMALTAQVGFLVHQIAAARAGARPHPRRTVGRDPDGHGDRRTRRARRVRDCGSICGASPHARC